MKSQVYVEKAVQQWRNMFSCAEDTTEEEDHYVTNSVKKKQTNTKSSKQKRKPKDPPSSQWLRQMTNKLATTYGNIERMDTDSTVGSQSEEPTAEEDVPVPVVETIRPAPTEPAAVVETLGEKNSSDPAKNPVVLTRKHKKTRPRGPKKRLGRNPQREEFYQTVVYDLGYDAADEDESQQDGVVTAQQDKAEKDDSNQEEQNDYGPSSTTKKPTSQSIDSHDAISISVMTMKEFDEDGNYSPDVIRKEHDYNNAQKLAQMMKGIDVKSSIARIRLHKQAEQQQRREEDDLRREKEELLQKRLQKRRREKERKEQRGKLQKQLLLQKKRDEEKQTQQFLQSFVNRKSSVSFRDEEDTWEDEFPLDGSSDDLTYSVSDMSGYLAPPSRVVMPQEEDDDDKLSSLRLIAETPSDEQDAPSDEEDEPESDELEPALEKTEEEESEWETFDGSNAFHKGSDEKNFRGWRSSGFFWVEQPWRLEL